MIQFARPCAYRRVRSLKNPLFLFQLANFPFFQQPVAFQPNFLFLASSTKSRARPPQGPRFSKIRLLVDRRGPKTPFRPHLGPIFRIFESPERHQKFFFFFASLQKAKKSIISGPRSVPEPFLGRCSWILEPCWHVFSNVFGYRFCIDFSLTFYRCSVPLNLAKSVFYVGRVTNFMVLQASHFIRF